METIYLAPMEGLTGYVYRNALHRCFHSIDRYFTPFLSTRGFGHRERSDVLPAHNEGMDGVPQILTNQADVFLEIAKQLEDRGYQEVNLNLGCPSGTVVTKQKGAGFLSCPEELERFLDTVFSSCPLKISIKTRVGMCSLDEWERLLAIESSFPLTELIIHPRLRDEYYAGMPHIECFMQAQEQTELPLVYNGDINTLADYRALLSQCKKPVSAVMLGRGILKNPWLAGNLRGEQGPRETMLSEFLDEILEGYLREMSGERDALFRMKELWSYLGQSFEDAQKYLKQIKKAKTADQYRTAVSGLLRDCRFTGGYEFAEEI